MPLGPREVEKIIVGQLNAKYDLADITNRIDELLCGLETMSDVSIIRIEPLPESVALHIVRMYTEVGWKSVTFDILADEHNNCTKFTFYRFY